MAPVKHHPSTVRKRPSPVRAAASLAGLALLAAVASAQPRTVASVDFAFTREDSSDFVLRDVLRTPSGQVVVGINFDEMVTGTWWDPMTAAWSFNETPTEPVLFHLGYTSKMYSISRSITGDFLILGSDSKAYDRNFLPAPLPVRRLNSYTITPTGAVAIVRRDSPYIEYDLVNFGPRSEILGRRPIPGSSVDLFGYWHGIGVIAAETRNQLVNRNTAQLIVTPVTGPVRIFPIPRSWGVWRVARSAGGYHVFYGRTDDSNWIATLDANGRVRRDIVAPIGKDASTDAFFELSNRDLLISSVNDAGSRSVWRIPPGSTRPVALPAGGRPVLADGGGGYFAAGPNGLVRMGADGRQSWAVDFVQNAVSAVYRLDDQGGLIGVRAQDGHWDRKWIGYRRWSPLKEVRAAATVVRGRPAFATVVFAWPLASELRVPYQYTAPASPVRFATAPRGAWTVRVPLRTDLPAGTRATLAVNVAGARQTVSYTVR